MRERKFIKEIENNVKKICVQFICVYNFRIETCEFRDYDCKFVALIIFIEFNFIFDRIKKLINNFFCFLYFNNILITSMKI